jgi:hypothetical protein
VYKGVCALSGLLAWAVRACRKEIQRFPNTSRYNKSASASLGNTEIFGIKDPHLAVVTELSEFTPDFIDNATAADCQHSRNILHHERLRIQDAYDTEILTEKPRPLIRRRTAVVVVAE